MPRETVAAGRGQFKVQVVWKRGIHAQLGIVNDGNECKIVDKDGNEFNSIWSDLDVDDVDQLQKVLRRVKRQLVAAPSTKKDDAYRPLNVGS